MSGEITFESGGKTWRYKDKPRFLNHGEYYWNPAADGVEKIKASNSSMKWTPVEPVEPAKVTVELETNLAKKVVEAVGKHGLPVTAGRLMSQLREQGVDV